MISFYLSVFYLTEPGIKKKIILPFTINLSMLFYYLFLISIERLKNVEF